jgi:acetyl esterase/lipase
MPADSTERKPLGALLGGMSALFWESCSRLGFLAANAAAVFGSYTRHANVAYGPDPRHRLDVYVPEGPPCSDRAVVVFWHGGRWREGDKADYRFVGAALAAECGYIAVIANYRRYPQVKMPGFMDDAAQAALWAAAHARDFGGAGERLYLMGHSAGAHLAALLSLDPRYFAACGRAAPRVAGMIGLSGPYDFLPLLDADVQDMFGPPQIYPQSQPINYVRAGAPPMLLIQGLKDDTVRPKNAINLAAALGTLGVPVTLQLYPNVSHSDTVAALTGVLRGRAPTLADIRDFVEPRGRREA